MRPGGPSRDVIGARSAGVGPRDYPGTRSFGQHGAARLHRRRRASAPDRCHEARGEGIYSPARGDRIGLIVFAELAYVAAAPTFDIAAVNEALDDVSIGLVGRSTAIGTGLGLALKRLRESGASTRLVILLSDGADNASSADPLAVARLAGTLGIRVHTIAFGLHDLANPEGDPDPVDTETLRKVAEASGGTAFRVHSTEELEEVSQSIERLESSRVMAPPSVIRKDLWFYPGALAFLASFALLLLDRRQT